MCGLLRYHLSARTSCRHLLLSPAEPRQDTPTEGKCKLPHLTRVLIPWAFVWGRGGRGEGPPGVCTCDEGTGMETAGGRKGRASSPPHSLMGFTPHSLTHSFEGTSIRVCVSREALLSRLNISPSTAPPALIASRSPPPRFSLPPPQSQQPPLLLMPRSSPTSVT